MQYQFTERFEYIKTIEFKNSNALLNVEKIKYFREEGVSGVFLKKEFKYSFDNSVWSNWNNLTQQNLSNINFVDQPNFYLQVKYTRKGINSGNIKRWYLFYDADASTSSVSPSDASIDADTLKGEGPEYYLNRENHSGPFTDLLASNITDPSSKGVYYNRTDSSSGTELIFRSIKGERGIIVSQSGGIISVDGSALNSSINKLFSEEVLNVGDGDVSIFVGRDASRNLQFRTISGTYGTVIQESGNQILIGIDASISIGENVGDGDASIYKQKVNEALQFREIKGNGPISVSPLENLILIDASDNYDTTLDPSLEMPSDVGGISSGTTVYDLKGNTLIQLWDNLLFPTVNPTYVAPDNSFSDNVSNLQEIGDILNITYTSSFDKGQILVNGNFQDYRSGNPINYNYTDPSSNTLLVDTSSASLSNVQDVSNYIVTIGTQTWTNTVDYNEGPQPYDNKGNPYGSPLSAGTTGSDTLSIEGVYPLFGTTVSIGTLTQQTLVSMLNANNIVFSMVSESGGDKQIFDIPSAWENSPTNRSLQGVETYNTVSSSWEYQGGNASNSLTFWTDSSTTHNIQGNSINYTRYTYNGTDRSDIQIRLKF